MTWIVGLDKCFHRLALLPLIAAFSLSGCATTKKPTEKETGKPVVFREFTLKDLRDELAARQRLVRSLSGNVEVEFSNRAVPGGTQSASGVFAFETPDKIRMTLGKTFVAHAQFDLISDGDRFWYVNHGGKTVQTGKCENLVGVESDKIGLRPMDIVDAYFLREMSDQPGFTKRITFLEAVGNYYIISVLRDDFPNLLYSKIYVDRFEAKIARHTLYDAEKGTPRVDAIFDRYEDIGGASIAHQMTINWPNRLASLSVKFRTIRLNPKWENPKIFIFDSTKPDYAFVDLDESAKMEQYSGLRERRPGGAPAPGYAPPATPGGVPPKPLPGPSPKSTPPSKGTRPAAPPEPDPNYVPPPNPYTGKRPKPKAQD